MRPSLVLPLTLAAAICGAPALAASPPEGFGNIPFGSSKDKALTLNAGNGTLADNPDKTATLSYNIMVAGLPFSVSQNFDADGRATDATLTYSSREDMPACIGRLNYILDKVNQRYGRPTLPVVSRHEDANGTRTDFYTVQYTFANKAGIKAAAQAAYPTPAPAGGGGNAAGGGAGGGAAPAAAAGGGTTSCQVTLQYLPPLWIAHF